MLLKPFIRFFKKLKEAFVGREYTIDERIFKVCVDEKRQWGIGENYIRSVLQIKPNTKVHIYKPHISTTGKVLRKLGGYERRPEGDTCVMAVRFREEDRESFKYYVWPGIVPVIDKECGLEIDFIDLSETFGILTGRAELKMVLIEKYKNKSSLQNN